MTTDRNEREETKRQAGKKRGRPARVLYVAGLLCIWTFLALLIVEFAQAAWRTSAVRSFESMMNERLIASEALLPTAEPTGTLVHTLSTGDVNTNANNAACTPELWEIPFGVGSVQEERPARHAFFPALSETERQHFARINCEIVAEIHAANALTNVYGDGFVLNFCSPQLMDSLEAIVRDHAAGKNLADKITFSIDNENGAIPITIPLQFATAAGNAGSHTDLYLFMPVEPIVRAIMLCVLNPENKENVRWEIPFVKYKANLREDCPTNNIGFYGDDVAVPKPDGVFRIVCIGGSTTEEREFVKQSYPVKLQNRFASDFGMGRVEVVNCGTPAITTMGHLLRLPDYLRLQPDFVILYLGVNDTCTLFSMRHALGFGAIRNLLSLSSILRFWLGWAVSPDERILLEAQRNTTIANLESMIRVFQQAHVGVALCSFAWPDPGRMGLRERMYFSVNAEEQFSAISLSAYVRAITNLNAEYQSLCSKMNLRYVPVAETLGGLPAYFLDICHMNDAGSREKTDIIYQYIKADIGSRLQAAPPSDETTLSPP